MDTNIDYPLFLILNYDGGILMDNIMWLMSSKLVCVPFILISLWIIYKRIGLRAMLYVILLLALIVLFADQTSSLFKNYLPRLRPTHQESLTGLVHTVNNYVGGLYGTVSAHAANTTGVLFLLSMIVKNRVFTIMSILFIILVCYSRIYLGVHFPLDIFFGIIWGLIYGGIAYLVFKYLIKNKRNE